MCKLVYIWCVFLKTETPLGQLPFLEVDGQVFCQSHAIERFLAKRFGKILFLFSVSAVSEFWPVH